MTDTIQVTLNQKEANLVLRAVEILQEACAAAVEPDEVKILSDVWDRVFDAGIENGFGSAKDKS